VLAVVKAAAAFTIALFTGAKKVKPLTAAATGMILGKDPSMAVLSELRSGVAAKTLPMFPGIFRRLSITQMSKFWYVAFCTTVAVVFPFWM